MTLSNIEHRGESSHRGGRTDAVLLFEQHVYVLEIKYASAEADVAIAFERAMMQIKEKNYALPYVNQGKDIRLLALVFSKAGLNYKEEKFLES
ncbi:PD-(D/E)XK nuclease domain-containing protein [Pedobacter sp. GR22-6]|uniref:PD-(D/E)XK nuclease domain-containing protein n=1 Tax=Pedobacter sp. GR22-6 TaxID=3127957 RepID=UPI00307EA515